MRSPVPAVLAVVAVVVPAAVAACGGAADAARVDDLRARCDANPQLATKVPPGRVAFAAHEKPPGTPVVVYGASWCGACALTREYLERRGIPYVDRDVDEDEGAARERAATLVASGLGPSSALPIVDIRGTVTIGFFPCVVEGAWAAP